MVGAFPGVLRLDNSSVLRFLPPADTASLFLVFLPLSQTCFLMSSVLEDPGVFLAGP